MAVVALIVHHDRPSAAQLAADCAAWLVAHGHDVRIPAEDAAVVGLDQHAVDHDRLVAGAELAVSLGGDGTMLRTVELVATPTGSTAYAFSARGPIVAPTHRALSLTPVSPHMLFDRTLVLDADTEVKVTVMGHRPSALTVDGRLLGELRRGDAVVCTRSRHEARFVIFTPRDFHQILKAKFGLSDR